MSKRKLQKYIDRPLNFNGSLTKHAILLSDSKGFSLKSHVDLLDKFNHQIEIIYQSGAQYQTYLNWLHKNLHKKVKIHRQIIIYVYLGTCDLTFKQGKFIKLRHSDELKAFSHIQSQITRYINFVSRFPTVKLVFLEIPPYSIVKYNEAKGHINPQDYHSQDLELTQRIAYANDYLREVNDRRCVAPPRFKLDLLKFRKQEGGKQRVSLNFKLYKDGIHPSYLSARCWMKRIVARMLADCL